MPCSRTVLVQLSKRCTTTESTFCQAWRDPWRWRLAGYFFTVSGSISPEGFLVEESACDIFLSVDLILLSNHYINMFCAYFRLFTGKIWTRLSVGLSLSSAGLRLRSGDWSVSLSARMDWTDVWTALSDWIFRFRMQTSVRWKLDFSISLYIMVLLVHLGNFRWFVGEERDLDSVIILRH